MSTFTFTSVTEDTQNTLIQIQYTVKAIRVKFAQVLNSTLTTKLYWPPVTQDYCILISYTVMDNILSQFHLIWTVGRK